MKCNQCEMLQITTGNISLPCHETGCPNAHKVWDEVNELWYIPDADDDEDDYMYQDEDRGGTGHGDDSYSDADPGL